MISQTACKKETLQFDIIARNKNNQNPDDSGPEGMISKGINSCNYLRLIPILESMMDAFLDLRLRSRLKLRGGGGIR